MTRTHRYHCGVGARRGDNLRLDFIHRTQALWRDHFGECALSGDVAFVQQQDGLRVARGKVQVVDGNHHQRAGARNVSV